MLHVVDKYSEDPIAAKVTSRMKAIRYHMSMNHCHMVKDVGDADDLPFPLVLTTRLDENTGTSAMSYFTFLHDRIRL